MKKIYDKNYSNQDLTIPAHIWNDKSVNGIQKIMLPLFKKMTNNGAKPIQALTQMQASILHTHEKDIKYNLQELHKKGYIRLFKDPNSKTGWSLTYHYNLEEPKATSDNSLF